MIVLQKLKINLDKSIDILTPYVEDKFNTYYQPTETLNRFDEIFFILKDKNDKTILVSEIVELIMYDTKKKLEEALKNEIILPNDINIGELGYNYNIVTYNENNEKFNLTKFILWSDGLTRTNLRTFIYNKDNKTYLEIAPVYPWIWDEPGTVTDIDYITFDEFMKAYKPITVAEIDSVTAQKWLQQCDEILKIMITV
jgi:hypothetical protein